MHASTGYTPFNLMHGYDPQLPVDILCGTLQQDDISHCKYVANLHVQKRLGHVFEKVLEKTGQSLVQQKAYYEVKSLTQET